MNQVTQKFEVKKHVLMPKHMKVSEKEKKELFDRHNISLKELPKIFSNDPSIKHLGVKAGDVVKIERNSPTAGKSVYYRGVVHG